MLRKHPAYMCLLLLRHQSKVRDCKRYYPWSSLLPVLRRKLRLTAPNFSPSPSCRPSGSRKVTRRFLWRAKTHRRAMLSRRNLLTAMNSEDIIKQVQAYTALSCCYECLVTPQCSACMDTVIKCFTL